MNVPALRFPEFEGEWAEEQLGALLHSHKLGGNYSNSLEPTEWPLIKMGNLKRGQMDVTKVEYIETGEEIDPDDMINKGDLFFNTRNTLDLVGKVAIWRDEIPNAYYNSNLLRLVFDCNDFMNLRLNSHSGVKSLKRVAAGTTSVAAIYTKDLLSVKAVVPSLPEQKKIAAFLGVVDARIAALRDRQAGLERYKRGLMQALFSQRLRFTKPDGTAFPDWEEKRLGDLGKFSGGGTPDTNVASYWSGEIPWISSSDVTEDDLTGPRITRWITKEAIQDSATKLVPAGSILIVSRVGVGKLTVATCDLCTSQDFTNFVPEKDEVQFLAYWMVANTNALLRLCQGTSIKGLTSDDLKTLRVRIPHPGEQAKIAVALSTMDAKIQAVVAQVNQMQAFKKGLLQQMFV